MIYLTSPQANNYFQIGKMNSWDYPIHLHSYYELLIGAEKSVTIVVENQKYTIGKGQAVIVFPYQLHGFVKEGGGYGYLCTFDGSLIQSFASFSQGLKPTSNLISLDFNPEDINNESDFFAVKSFLYKVCSHMAKELDFSKMNKQEVSLLNKVFTLTEQNYRDESFSLRELARLINYDYGYISKNFKKQTGLNYNDYLNYTRVAYAAQLLETTENISEVAMASGYNCVRSFNRNFKMFYGESPSQFMNESRNKTNVALTSVVKRR